MLRTFFHNLLELSVELNEIFDEVGMKMHRMFKMRITKLYLSVYFSMSCTKNTGKNVSRPQKVIHEKQLLCKNYTWSANVHVVILFSNQMELNACNSIKKNSIFV